MSRKKIKPLHLVPAEKLSKKKRREMDRSRRVTWGEMSPVTRVPRNSKAYDRAAGKRALRAESV